MKNTKASTHLAGVQVGDTATYWFIRHFDGRYWSRASGWAQDESFSLYKEQEKNLVKLPDGGEWVSYESWKEAR